jgi:hypothetical protein
MGEALKSNARVDTRSEDVVCRFVQENHAELDKITEGDERKEAYLAMFLSAIAMRTEQAATPPEIMKARYQEFGVDIDEF